ncbi:MAG: hypothetical protein ACK5JU_09295, partial [Bacteroidales bacterium]
MKIITALFGLLENIPLSLHPLSGKTTTVDLKQKVSDLWKIFIEQSSTRAPKDFLKKGLFRWVKKINRHSLISRD